MLATYEQLKTVFAQEGYERALNLLDQHLPDSPRQEILQTNLYCYLTIQRNYKPSKTLTILQSALGQKECKGAIRALTRYHICQIYFPTDLEICGRECEEIIG